MSNLLESIITSDSTGVSCSSCVWNHRTGTALVNHKGGGISVPHTLCYLRNEFLLSADSTKPLIHVWAANSQQTAQSVRFVCPGKVTALAATPDGNYIVAGIEEKIYIWQMCSGKLLAVLNRHFQTVTCLKFTDDGSCFVSAGIDGHILVWKLASLVQINLSDYFFQSSNENKDPLFQFLYHSSAVTDLVIGRGGIASRLYSTSLDRTCKISCLASGQLLRSFVFETELYSVTTDTRENVVFVGGSDGKIYFWDIVDSPKTLDQHLNGTELRTCLVGHKDRVTCLSTSCDGTLLLSGSDDGRVILWNVTKFKEIREFHHSGSVTNAFFIRNVNVTNNSFKPKLLLSNLQKSTQNDESYVYKLATLHTQDIEITENLKQNGINCAIDTSVETDLRQEIDQLKNVNKALYAKAIENIIRANRESSNESDVVLVKDERATKKRKRIKKRKSINK